MEQPFRLLLPSPDARVARTVVEDGTNIDVATPIVVLVPIVQWDAIRIRGRIDDQAGTLGFAFCRPNRSNEPGGAFGEAFEYTADPPSIDATAWVAGTEFSLEIPGSEAASPEHYGENWLKITLTASVDGATVAFLDVSGIMVGNYH